jgi:hypothetical protein
MAKIKDKAVHLKSPDGERVVLLPGDTIPDWAEVPPSVIAEEPKKAPVKRRTAKKKAPTKKQGSAQIEYKAPKADL